MRSTGLLLLATLLVTPAFAQNDFELPKIARPVVQDQAQGGSADFQQILSGKILQESLALKDLGSDWRRVTIRTTSAAGSQSSDIAARTLQAAMLRPVSGASGRDDSASAALGISLLSGLFSGETDPVYYTKGQTVIVSGETFVVAYEPERSGAILGGLLLQTRAAGKEPDPVQLAAAMKLTPESRVMLTLINTKSISSLGKIRPFNLDAEIADSARPGASMLDWLVAQPPVAQRVPPPAVTAAKPAPVTGRASRKPKPR